jgi:hypothetical protein
MSISASDHAGQKRGDESRALIKNALRDRRARGLSSPTLDELVEPTGLSKTTVNWHLGWMVRHGEVRIEAARREIVLLDEARP